MSLIARIFAPIWKELLYVGGAIIAVLSVLTAVRNNGAREERLRQKEGDHEVAERIRDSVRRSVDRGLRVDDRRGYRDGP